MLLSNYEASTNTYRFNPIINRQADHPISYTFNNLIDALQFSEIYHESPCFAVATYYLMKSIKGEE